MITREHESGIDFYQQFPQALSTVLSRCGIDIADGGQYSFVSERFTETSPADCTDLAQLESWIDQAITITSIDELFGTDSAGS